MKNIAKAILLVATLTASLVAQQSVTKLTKPVAALVKLEPSKPSTVLVMSPIGLEYSSVLTREGQQVVYFSTGINPGQIRIVAFSNNKETGVPDVEEFLVQVVRRPSPDPVDPVNPDNPIDPIEPDDGLAELSRFIQVEGRKAGVTKEQAKKLSGYHLGIASKIAAVSNYTGNEAIADLEKLNVQVTLPTTAMNYVITYSKEAKRRALKNGIWQREELREVLEEIGEGYKAL